MAADALRDVVSDQGDLDRMIWTVVWCVHGFLGPGMLRSERSPHPDRGQDREIGASPAEISAFRVYLHQLLTRMLVFTTP
jgi:hypothetical protein